MLDTYRKILALLDRRERRAFYWLVFLTLVMGLIDTFAVATILPFLAVVANPAMVERSPILAALYNGLGFGSTRDFLLFLGGCVFAIVTFGIAFRAFGFYTIAQFTRMRSLSLATRLLARYLAQPYSWYLDRHSAELGRKVLGEVIEVVSGSIASALRLMPNVVIVLLLILLLVALQPVAALVAAALVSVCYGIVFLLIQGRLNALGEDRLEANRQRFQIFQNALGGIKDVKLLNLEHSFLGQFRGPAIQLANAQAKMTIIGDLPRHVLEAVAFGGMILFVLWLLVAGDGRLDAIVPILGVYAFAGFRLFPTIQQVYAGVATMAFGKPGLDSLYRDLTQAWVDAAPDNSALAPLQLRQRLELDQVRFAYPSAGRLALDGLTLAVAAHSTVGLVGTTGAGKTTAIDILLGLLEPAEGALRVDGVVIDRDNVGAWQKSVGYVPQTIFLIDDTIAANIAFGIPADRVDRAALERAARVAQLDVFVATLPKGFDTLIGERGARLSGGQRQRIGIARALYRDPDMLIFDEATNALDNTTERAVMDAVKALGHDKTIVIVAHRLTTVRHCDAIFVLDHGRVVASGTYDALIENSGQFRALHESAL